MKKSSHRLNRGEVLCRDVGTFTFRVGPDRGPFVTARKPQAEALIDHRLVDKQPQIDGERSHPSAAQFLINDQGREWCAAHPA